MVITEALWNILLLFIPGIITFVIFRHVAGYAINAVYKLLIYVAVFGLIDYALIELLLSWIYDFDFGTYLPVWKVLSYQYEKVDIGLISWVSAFGIVFGFISGLIFLAARKRVKSSLHVKLWDHILHREELKNKMVVISDYENGKCYIGKIKNFSYFSHYREIVLTDAWVEGEPSKVWEEIYLHLKENKFDIRWGDVVKDPNKLLVTKMSDIQENKTGIPCEKTSPLRLFWFTFFNKI